MGWRQSICVSTRGQNNQVVVQRSVSTWDDDDDDPRMKMGMILKIQLVGDDQDDEEA